MDKSPASIEVPAAPPASGRAPADAAFAAIYEELKRQAHRQLFGQGATIFSTTALVNEAYLRLAAMEHLPSDRGHFLALAARAMRFVLVDHARARSAGKRGGGAFAVTLSTTIPAPEGEAADVLALDRALQRLGELDPRLAQVVEWRYFGGLCEAEIAQMSGVTERTVRRDWRKARAFLYRELEGAAP